MGSLVFAVLMGLNALSLLPSRRDRTQSTGLGWSDHWHLPPGIGHLPPPRCKKPSPGPCRLPGGAGPAPSAVHGEHKAYSAISPSADLRSKVSLIIARWQPGSSAGSLSGLRSRTGFCWGCPRSVPWRVQPATGAVGCPCCPPDPPWAEEDSRARAPGIGRRMGSSCQDSQPELQPLNTRPESRVEGRGTQRKPRPRALGGQRPGGGRARPGEGLRPSHQQEHLEGRAWVTHRKCLGLHLSRLIVNTQ